MSIKFKISRFPLKIIWYMIHLLPNAPKTLSTPQRMCFTYPHNIVFALSA